MTIKNSSLKWLAIAGCLILIFIFSGTGPKAGLFQNLDKRSPAHTARLNTSWGLGEVRKLCAGKEDRSKSILCFRENLEEGVKAHGIKPFIEKLEIEFAADDEAEAGGITGCHDLAHAIGELGGINAKGLNTTLADCTEICTFGCYHGAVEGYVAKHGTFLQELPDLCEGELFTSVSQSSRGACFHGLGHGVASIAGFDLAKALELCNRINEKGRGDCGLGVLMELYELSSFTHATLEFPEDIPGFCKNLGNVYEDICYTVAGMHEYGRSRDTKRAFETCRSVPLPHQRPCQVQIGQNFLYVFQGRPQDIYRNCSLALKAEERRACLEGTLIASIVSDPLARHGFELCSVVEEDFKPFCFQFLEKNRRPDKL